MLNNRNLITEELIFDLLNEIKEEGSIEADRDDKRIFFDVGHKYFKSDGKKRVQAFHGTIWQDGLSLTDEGEKYLSNYIKK